MTQRDLESQINYGMIFLALSSIEKIKKHSELITKDSFDERDSNLKRESENIFTSIDRMAPLKLLIVCIDLLL